MTDIHIELVSLGKSYGGRALFVGLDAAAGPGECLAIRGPNGSGKSTLLKIIAGLVRPSAGRARVVRQGKALDNEQRRGVIGLISPDMVFYHPLTALENMTFFLTITGRALPREAILHHLERAGLGLHADRPVGIFSTGMRQRLKFALLMALDASLLLLDEPGSNLDADGRSMAGQFLREALAGGKTVVLASNEQWETDYGTRTILLA